MSAPQSVSSPAPAHRTECSNLRAALTLPTLGRRRSTSCLQFPQHPPEAPAQHQPSALVPASPAPDPVQLPSPAKPSSSMLLHSVSRFLEWLHVDTRHNRTWSIPSSARSSVDEPVLPVSAPPHKESFDITPQNPTAVHIIPPVSLFGSSTQLACSALFLDTCSDPPGRVIIPDISCCCAIHAFNPPNIPVPGRGHCRMLRN